VLRRILFLLLALQLADLGLLVWLSYSIGFWETLTLALGTGVLGGALARREGRRVWRGWREALDARRPPEEGITDGMLVLVGSALLMAPGLATDVIAAGLLVPWSRRWVAKWLRPRLSLELEQRFALRTPLHGRADRGGLGGSLAQRGSSEPVIDTTGVESPE
jgi:UPF0716 protein FxsA